MKYLTILIIIFFSSILFAANPDWEKLNPDNEEKFDLDYFLTHHKIKDKVKRSDERIYGLKKDVNAEYPPDLKCTKSDYRLIHTCIQARFFSPSTRVYFDTGHDDVNEVDIFNDGNLNITMDFINLYLPWRLGRGRYYDKWTWGPIFGVGIGAPAKDSENGETSVSGAPVVLFSAGGLLEYTVGTKGSSFAFEFGYSHGITSDESFGDNDDGAVFVGLKITIPTDKFN